MTVPDEYFEMAKSMKGLSENKLGKVLFLLDCYMKQAIMPTLEGFYTKLEETTEEMGPLR